MRRSFLLLFPVLFFSSCHVVRFFVWNFADIHDYKKFPKNSISKPVNPFLFKEANGNTALQIPKEITIKGEKYSFDEMLKKTKTVAFLIIRNDSMLYEKYLYNYDKSSVVPSFSSAKSFVSALAGIAIDEGYIKDVNEPITNYLPELDKNKFGNITIEDVLDMQSGIKYNEGYYNPFGDVAKYYYGTNIKKYIKKLKIKEAPGKTFEYISVNTELLGLIIEHATGKHLYQYLEEKIWKNTGMEYDASWSIDSRKNQTEKAFCCINARARDFAKFGRLYLHNGNWNGKQIISEKWVKQSTQFATEKNGYIYSYQWWHNPKYTPIGIEAGNDFYAHGLLGQYIYVYPSKNIIIVRLGKKEGNIYWAGLFKAIAEKN